MNTLFLENQFGEISENYITGGNSPSIAAIATNTVVANLTGGSAVATAVTVQALANKLPAKTGVAAISAEAASVAVTIALSTGNTYSDAAVNTAVNTGLASVNTALNVAITQMNAILAALKVQS